jgi:putative flippase GtrA
MKVVNSTSLSELFTIGRFTLVGVLATIVHVGIAWLLIVYAEFVPIIANFSAFLFAFIVSFTGHYHWTFSARVNRVQALKRFLIITGTAFAANNVVLVGLLKIEVVTPVLATIYAIFLIPVFTYILSRLWVFRS